MHLRGKYIFVVEDNITNATIMKLILQAAGAKVLHDSWCIDTPKRIKSAGHIDLILMDLMLPNGLTGYDVFDQLQKDPQLSTIPAVVVSASDASLEIRKARQKGFVGYISKPINNQTFARLIASVLDGHEVWDDE